MDSIYPFQTVLISALFLVAGIAHFIFPDPYLKVMPAYIPQPKAMVFWSGVAEVAGGSGFFFQPTRTAATLGLLLLLLAVLPANVEMLRQEQRGKNRRFVVILLALRIPLQFVLMWWIWSIGWVTS
ncbi:MAG: hypothetical protein AAFW89_07100 [Bacteroidota bacterium]